MGGVDLVDMLVSLYRISIRSKKYYLKIVFHFIDLSIVNGWLLYRRHCLQLRLHTNEIRSLLQFRVEIAEALLKPIVPQRPIQQGRPTVRLQSREASPYKNSRTTYVRVPSVSTRLDEFHHWPMSTSK